MGTIMPLTSADLVALLDLEPAGVDRFIGRSPDMGWARVYGGQVVAQALVAAVRTVPGGRPIRFTPISCSAAIRPNRSCSRSSGCATAAASRPAASGRASAASRSSSSPPRSRSPRTAPSTRRRRRQRRRPSRSSTRRRRSPLMPEPARKRLQTLFDRVRPIEFRPMDMRRYAPLRAGETRAAEQSVWIRIGGPLARRPDRSTRRRWLICPT